MNEPIFEQSQLDRAYQRGYMSGRLGMDPRNCPYKAELVRAAWQQGWREGRAETREAMGILPT